MPSQEDKNAIVISYLSLRKAIGWLGILLPVLLILVNRGIGHCDYFQNSISHFYYTNAGNVFVGILCSVGIFLLSYKGYTTTPEGKTDYRDRIATSLAGLFAIGVAMFPTNVANDITCNLLYLDDNTWRNATHYFCASSFFILLAYMSYYRFTISKHDPSQRSKKKKIRNKLYKICGIVIINCIVLIPAADFIVALENTSTTFWLEWIALVAFGTSWLVKGELMFSDDK